MEHLRRRDQWTNLLQQASLVLLPWNPAVLWLNRQRCFERELACDDGVLRATNSRKTYAACLVRLAEDSMLRRKISLALGILGAFQSRARESELVTRVRRILTIAEPRKVSKSLQVATGIVLATVIGLSILLTRSPRLIDFASTPVTLASAASSETQPLSALPVSRTEGPRPTLVKAVISGPGSKVPLATAAVLHKHTVRHRALRAMQSTTPIPLWRDRTRTARPGITLVAAEDSQRLYAAVPWPGGWLLIQL
jgi:hypothetical protein